jgi:hypothetical protein
MTVKEKPIRCPGPAAFTAVVVGQLQNIGQNSSELFGRESNDKFKKK